MFWLGLSLGGLLGFIGAAACHRLQDRERREWIELHKKYSHHIQPPRVIR